MAKTSDELRVEAADAFDAIAERFTQIAATFAGAAAALRNDHADALHAVNAAIRAQAPDLPSLEAAMRALAEYRASLDDDDDRGLS